MAPLGGVLNVENPNYFLVKRNKFFRCTATGVFSKIEGPGKGGFLLLNLFSNKEKKIHSHVKIFSNSFLLVGAEVGAIFFFQRGAATSILEQNVFLQSNSVRRNKVVKKKKTLFLFF